MVLRKRGNMPTSPDATAVDGYFNPAKTAVKSLSIIASDKKMAASYRAIIGGNDAFQLRDILTLDQWEEAAPLYIFPDVLLLCLDNAAPKAIALAEQLTALQYEHQFRLIIQIDSAWLDAVAHLALDGPEFLFAQASAYEIGPVLAKAFAPTDQLVLQDDQQALTELQRLSADAERIAEALARLSAERKRDIGARAPVGFDPIAPLAADDDRADTGGLAETALGFRGMAKLKALSTSDNQPAVPAAKPRAPTAFGAAEVRQLLKARRMREAYFDSELFADPAWDILLDLYAAHLEGAKVSVSSLCIAANVPPTTGLRWIRSMTDAGILVRRDDQSDGRRVWIELSDSSLAKLVGYFSRLRKDGLIAI
jgi:DNA-binding MarR family transcriptional regulator